jgi:small subunit ribosomal protein S11
MPKKKRAHKKVSEGKAYIQSTFNNTAITAGFKGSRKGTPYAAQLAARDAAQRAMNDGLRRVEVYIKGPGSGREAAIRALQASGITVAAIRDVTPIPHDGCRPPGRRRV